MILDMLDPNKNTEDEKLYIPVTYNKINGNIRRKVNPENKDSTGLLELSLKKNTYFGVIHNDIHIGMN